MTYDSYLMYQKKDHEGRSIYEENSKQQEHKNNATIDRGNTRITVRLHQDSKSYN
jgi:hypothetical protein